MLVQSTYYTPTGVPSYGPSKQRVFGKKRRWTSSFQSCSLQHLPLILQLFPSLLGILRRRNHAGVSTPSQHEWSASSHIVVTKCLLCTQDLLTYASLIVHVAWQLAAQFGRFTTPIMGCSRQPRSQPTGPTSTHLCGSQHSVMLNQPTTAHSVQVRHLEHTDEQSSRKPDNLLKISYTGSNKGSTSFGSAGIETMCKRFNSKAKWFGYRHTCLKCHRDHHSVNCPLRCFKT